MVETIGVKIGRKTVEIPLDEVWEFDSSGRMIYHGQAAPGTATSEAKWRICKYTYTGNNFNADDKRIRTIASIIRVERRELESIPFSPKEVEET